MPKGKPSTSPPAPKGGKTPKSGSKPKGGKGK